MRKSRQTSFDVNLYRFSDDKAQFYSTIRGIYEHISACTSPSKFHHFMDDLAREGRLLRHYTQNIDCLERQLPDLERKTVRLHGQVNEARCSLCNWTGEISPNVFVGEEAPKCQGVCMERSVTRQKQGKRPLEYGRLRPNILLYGEDHWDEDSIWKIAKNDLRQRPDLVLVVGTRLKVPTPRQLAARFCDKVLETGGLTVWVNRDGGLGVDGRFTYLVEQDCDAFISLFS
jgi:NAD-dependent histone deacetylase SIR2